MASTTASKWKVHSSYSASGDFFSLLFILAMPLTTIAFLRSFHVLFFFLSIRCNFESEMNLPMSAMNQKGILVCITLLLLQNVSVARIEDKKKNENNAKKCRNRKVENLFLSKSWCWRVLVCMAYSYNKYGWNWTSKNSMMNRSLNV